MDVSGDYTFDAPQELAWKALQDPEVLASIMPGGEDFKEIGENEYSGLLNVKVGPVQGQFTGVIKLSDIVAPESYSMQVDGKGGPGFVKAKGSLKLTEQGKRTYMAYEGNVQIGGRIASVGQRLLEASMKSIIRQSLDGLNEYLKVQAASSAAQETVRTIEAEGEVAPTESTPESPTFTPPSQSTIAKNVFLDLFGELIPAQYRPVAIGLLVVVAILILFQILR
jgi:carbon monoxide dehydrogenase subunit G